MSASVRSWSSPIKEVIISWVTDRSVPREVRYSLDQSYSELTPASSEMYDGKYWHSATITSLQDETTYHYRVYGGGMDLTPCAGTTFTTAPEAAASRFVFVVLGDNRPQTTGSPPSAGAPLYYVGSSWFTAHSASLHHFLKAEVDGCQLRIETVDDSGNVFDSWVLDRCPP